MYGLVDSLRATTSALRAMKYGTALYTKFAPKSGKSQDEIGDFLCYHVSMEVSVGRGRVLTEYKKECERLKILWTYGSKGAVISGAVSAVGTALVAMLGGWDQPLKALLLFMVMDFVLGVLAAVKRGELDSKVSFWGGINKLLLLCFVAVGVVLDSILPLEEPYCRTAVIFFYIGREGLSMVENYGKLGGVLPEFLRNVLAQLKENNDERQGE